MEGTSETPGASVDDLEGVSDSDTEEVETQTEETTTETETTEETPSS